MKQRKWLCPVIALAAVLTVNSGVLTNLSLRAQDRLYQQRQTVDDRIVIIGIDERALEDIGPFQTWGRDVTAQALEYLNSGEAGHPAVIALDILFTGETNPESDIWLVEEALAGENVVMASAARFGSSLVHEPNGNFYMDPFSVLCFDEPYKDLKEASSQGHINAMMDRDGILRRSLLYVTLEDGRQIPSFACRIAELYQKNMGFEPLKKPGTDANGFWYLPYSGLPGDFYEGFSVSDLLERNLPPDFLDNKIVLIGPYAAGLQDSYLTAIDHAIPMFGVEYQANAVQAVLEGNYKSEAGNIVQSLLLFFVVWLCVLWFTDKKVLSSALLWLLVCVGWIILCKISYEHGAVLPVIYIPMFVTILFIGTVAIKYGAVVVEKYKVTSTFKRYVAPEIVNEILKEGVDSLELGGKMYDIAVLFVDIRGFTTMSEVLTPPQVVEILNRYLTLTSSCIMKNAGTLDKFIGDATMAFWGAPLPQEDYVMHAAQAAIDMVEGSKVLSEELMKTYGRTVSFGIGIQTGSAVVGNIGARSRMDYTAIGDTVNTAARLEANAPAGTIYITKAVADALEGRVKVTSLGESIHLKGKSAVIEIFTLDSIL